MGVDILATVQPGPWWLSVPLGGILFASLFFALRGRTGQADVFPAAGFSVAGFLLLAGSNLMDGSPGVTELLLYGAAQAWILSFWALRGFGGGRGGDDDGGEPRDGDDGGPPWWPEFEREFRDYARRSRPHGPRPRATDRLPG